MSKTARSFTRKLYSESYPSTYLRVEYFPKGVWEHIDRSYFYIDLVYGDGDSSVCVLSASNTGDGWEITHKSLSADISRFSKHFSSLCLVFIEGDGSVFKLVP